METILADLDRIILPGITHWQSPNFFAYFPANTSGPSVLAELISAGLGVQGMLWSTSPACTELETHVLDWLVEAMQMPARFKSSGTGGGTLQDSASSAALCAILAARERITKGQSNLTGVPPNLVAYVSTQTHSSIEKALMVAGIGRLNLRKIAVDDHFALRTDELAREIQKDRAAGKIPFFLCATIGTTSSNAVDPLEQIGRICQQEQIWMHVDSAMAGVTALCPEFRSFFEGLQYADSYCFNPHKWMFTNFDCSCFYLADRKSLTHAMSINPEYLSNAATDSGLVMDYRDWQVPLGRRFRSLKLWFVLRYYGIEGLQHHLREHIRLARLFAQWVRESSQYELIVEPPFNLVCFRHRSGDALNRQLLETLNNSGRLFLSHTVLDGKYTLRFCVGQTHTEESHARNAWKTIEETARNLSETVS
jgi:aromatic-L-amino-acid decarboxylase